MRANFENAYRELPPEAARMIRLLGLQPGEDIEPAAAAVLADVPETDAEGLLRTLAEHGLVTEAHGGRFRLPGPLRDYARERAEREETAEDREAAVRRVLDHYLAGPGGDGTRVEAEGLALLARERWTEAAEALEDGLRRAERDGDHREVLLARHNLGRALIETGDADRALDLLGPLPDAFATLPDRYHRGRALMSLGQAYLRLRRPVTALNLFGQALEIMRAEETVEQQGDVFVHIADAARLRGDPVAEGAALDRAAELYACVPSPKADRAAERRAALGS
ncbi:tetratricopeptide repeat protein [Actinomadura rubrisoli]|uniref:Tetratricopeptide repeat protein n=1 Tax=Actinomadura rubrisoli TaxID=2530368 RepID=A0A4R5ATC6_9ACTN|nr:tetratricopeptide repeat protein [Actinomadura rubrisoli]TDD73742.1 tetratricopeptide repeat protein [Actinomadura rubrisoli]